MTNEALKTWREVSTWLIERNIPLWDPLYFDDAFIDRIFATGHIIAVCSRGDLTGVAIVQWSDAQWWPDSCGAACYLHKIAVRRVSAGSGALETLSEGCEQLARSRQATLCGLMQPSIGQSFTTYRSALALHGSIHERLGHLRVSDFKKKLQPKNLIENAVDARVPFGFEKTRDGEWPTWTIPLECGKIDRDRG